MAETLAELDTLNPTLANEIRAELSAKRLRDDLADAEQLLREHARTARDAIGRAVAVLLVEYDRREGRVVREPQQIPVSPAPVVRPPRPTTPQGDVIIP